jgi:hypothetical protein
VSTAVDSLKPRESTAISTPLWPRILLKRWHLLSLDAPTVAALWSWFFARAMHIELPWHAPLLLALGTWLVYVADRILDGTCSDPSTPLRERHRFHTRHRKAFLTASAAVGCTLIWLIIARMSTNARYEDTVLFSAALLYLVLVHKPRLGGTGAPGDRSSSLGLGTSWLPKELAVGIVFAAATAVPAWSRLRGPALNGGRPALFPAAVLFAAVCWLNCVAIERWENLTPTKYLQPPDAHPTTRWVAGHFALVTTAIASFAVIPAVTLALLSKPSDLRETVPIYAADASAALALVLLDSHRLSFSKLQLRIAADLALLTPLLFLPFLA